MKSDVISGASFDDSDVRAFIESHDAAQLYHTATWRKIIERDTESSAISVVTRDTVGDIVGWMPIFLKQGPVGIIANSSPYFGSHGGILAKSPEAFDGTLKAAVEYLRGEKVVSLNVIHPLKDAYRSRYADRVTVAAESARVAHVKSLDGMNDKESLYESLAGLTRSNLRRKCWKSGITVERDGSEDAVSLLLMWHEAQMQAMGVQPKSRAFFDGLLSGQAEDSVEGRLYIGRRNGEAIAALFVCGWREWIEYLTPAFDLEHRKVQPLTAVIFESMLDCAADGFKSWNFGGSGTNLTGVRAFKESWNGHNIDYTYYVIDTGGLKDVRHYAQENGTRGYDGYFLYPF